MLSHDISPVILWIGKFPLTYYWLVYLAGFILAFVLLLKASKNKEINITPSQARTLVLLTVVGLIIGARVFHIVFWYLDYYLADPIRMLKIWQGGVSFHGGLVGALLVGFIYCKKKKINFLQIADLFAFLGILMPAFTRLCNFINQEIVGTVTNVPWCFKFKYNDGCRHPVQLYASLGRAIFFGMVVYWHKKLKRYKEGFIFWLFIFGIGLGRFALDFWRKDVIYLGLKAGQWLSLPMIFIGIIVLVKYYQKDLERIMPNWKIE